MSNGLYRDVFIYEKFITKSRVVFCDDMVAPVVGSKASRSNHHKPQPFEVDNSKLCDPLQTDINTRFGFYDKLLEATMRNRGALMVMGQGGIGKSYHAAQMFDKLSLQENIDYERVGGFSSDRALFDTIKENSTKILFFDDCDSILESKISKSILKGALDMFSKKRVVSWNIARGKSESFVFEGSVIFITNLNVQQLDAPTVSRCASIDLSMTRDEMVERLDFLRYDMCDELGIARSIGDHLIDLIKDIRYNIKDLNNRSFLNAAALFDPYEVAKSLKMARFMLTA
jgi:hypothetical protein